MTNAIAETVTREWEETHHGVVIPHAETVIYTDHPRSVFVAKMRDLADRVERGQLNGARCEWNDNPDQPAMVYVECFPVTRCESPEDVAAFGEFKRTTRLVRVTFEPTRKPRLVSQEGG